jgi:hypothetical protein
LTTTATVAALATAVAAVMTARVTTRGVQKTNGQHLNNNLSINV